VSYEEKCPYCDGTGIIAARPPLTTQVCTRCEGRGWVACCVMEPRLTFDERQDT
jgi:DnaJ-class molecular chaperone